jgi:hypothetical protein
MAWWWERLGGEDGLMVGTAWWWRRLGDEDEFRQRLKLFILSYLI